MEYKQFDEQDTDKFFAYLQNGTICWPCVDFQGRWKEFKDEFQYVLQNAIARWNNKETGRFKDVWSPKMEPWDDSNIDNEAAEIVRSLEQWAYPVAYRLWMRDIDRQEACAILKLLYRTYNHAMHTVICPFGARDNEAISDPYRFMEQWQAAHPEEPVIRMPDPDGP